MGDSAAWSPAEATGRRTAVFVGIFALALLVRAVAAVSSGAAAPAEIRYVTIGQGIVEGRGFQGLDRRFPDIIQPPLYPILTGLASLLVPDPLVGARGISVLAGSLMLFPIAALARSLLGEAAALRAAFLVAVHPLLVHISGLSMTEPLFGLLISFAALPIFRSLADGPNDLRALSAGGLLGLAFLTRPEGLAFLAAGSVLLLAAARPFRPGHFPRALALSMMPAAAFVAVAAPYWIWLHGETGRWQISPKAVMTQAHNYIMTRGIEEGWPEAYGSRTFYERVKFGLNEEGTDLRAEETLRALGLERGDAEEAATVRRMGDVIDLEHLTKVVVRNLRQLYLKGIKYGLVIPTLLLGFLAVGITSRPWTPGPFRRAHLALLLLVAVGGSWVFSHYQARFLFSSILFLTPWMGEGWRRVEAWLEAGLPELQLAAGGALARAFRGVSALVVALACLVHAVPPVRTFSAEWVEHRDAGSRLRAGGNEPGAVMALTPVVAYYAGMPFEMMPYADTERLLRYARMKEVRYLVADAAEFRRDRPQLTALLDPAQAPGGTLVVLDINRHPSRRLVTYRILEDAALEP